MTYIEEVNEAITKQLEDEKNNSAATIKKLATTNQILEQLELKIKRQDEQIKKLQVTYLGNAQVTVIKIVRKNNSRT